MKSLYLSLFLIFTLGWSNVNCFIVERKLVGKEDLAEQFYEGVNDRIEKLLAENDIENTDEPTSGHQKIFLLKTKGDARIEVQRASNEIEITMKNKYEELKVTSENMDYEKQKLMIDEQFLLPFISHLGEIVTGVQDAYQVIEKALGGLKVSTNSGTVYTVGTSTPLDGASAEALQFDISVDGQGMEDGIFGELVSEDESFKLRFVTKYFQNEFILNVRTKNYLAKEAVNLMTKILNHMEKMIRLNEGNGNDDPSAEQSLDVNTVKASVNSVFKDALENKGFTLADGEKGVKINKDDKEVLSIDFDVVEVGGYNFMNVKCTLPQLDNKVFSQNFLQSSLYQMSGILDAYLENIKEYMLHSVEEENPDEYVAAFATESRRRARVLEGVVTKKTMYKTCLLYTSPSPRDLSTSRMPSSA